MRTSDGIKYWAIDDKEAYELKKKFIKHNTNNIKKSAHRIKDLISLINNNPDINLESVLNPYFFNRGNFENFISFSFGDINSNDFMNIANNLKSIRYNSELDFKDKIIYIYKKN